MEILFKGIMGYRMFGLPQMDFGATVESFEGFQRLSRQYVNTGSVWLDDGGARISFVMSRKRWNRGIWTETFLSKSCGMRTQASKQINQILQRLT